MAGVYIHIPFCKNKCSYCDFFSIASTTYLRPTLSAIEQEIAEQKDFFSSRKIDTIYIGGGTPSCLDIKQVESLFSCMAANLDLSSLGEVTFEANPEDVSLEYFEGLLKNTPINRLSMGVQSFDDDILKFMRRRHSAQGAKRAYYEAREAGFDNISLDLIYGVPGMSENQWADSLAQMIELNPEHISAYHLSIEQGTRFGMMLRKGEINPVAEQVSEQNYDMLCETLSGAGYEHYEISNFAKPLKRAVHNSSYWSGEPYLGVGAGAHSFDGQQRRSCEQKIKDYIQKREYISEKLSLEDKFNEFIMLTLRTKDGLNLAMLEKTFPSELTEHFLEQIKILLKQSLVQVEGENVKINEENWLISDNIMAKLFV